jgi:hypothetical protein
MHLCKSHKRLPLLRACLVIVLSGVFCAPCAVAQLNTEEPQAVHPITVGLILAGVLMNVPGDWAQPSGSLEPVPTLTFRETDYEFRLEIQGGDFDVDGTLVYPFTGGHFWGGSITISQDSGFFNDVLTVGVTWFHKPGAPLPPHQQHGLADSFTWNVVADADDDPVAGLIHKVKFDGVNHGSHTDDYFAQLDAAVSTTGFLDDITSWTFILTGEHPNTDTQVDPSPVPEASTLWMGVMAAALCAAQLHRRTSRSC